MKLVEILARELDKWPAPDEEYGQIESMSQATDFQVSHYAGVRQKWREDLDDWDGSVGDGYIPCSRFTLSKLATDHATAIVTRADWEAGRAKLKATKANGYGWVRHRGGKCPVEAGVLVEVRNRAGDIALTGGASCTSVSWHWSHGNHPGDIMAYKIHKPAEQKAPVSEETIKATEPGKFDAIATRDRIRELDTQRAEVESTYQSQISEITQERESLVQKLAGEGLALVEVAVQPVEDMSDWREWKKGDVVMCVSQNHKWSDKAELGASYRLSENPTMNDEHGLNVWVAGFYMNPADFKFVSRPAS